MKSRNLLTLLFAAFTLLSMAPASAQDNMAPAKPEDISPLLIGERVPAMMLPDAKGNMTDVNGLMAKKPTVLVFYRGGWCPYCSKQLSGLQEIKASLAQMGYQLLAVSTDSPEKLSESMGKQKLDYTLLSDADLSVSKKFGLAFKAPQGYHKLLPATTGGKDTDMLLPVPSVFIVGTDGKIQFEYINPDYTQRMDPALLKAAATMLMTKKQG